VSAEPRLLQAFLDDEQQRCRHERLAQAAPGAELDRHAEKIRRIGAGLGEGVAGDRHQRDLRRALMEDPDRLEAMHLRHEDVDDQQIEGEALQRLEPGLGAVGSDDVITVPPQHNSDRLAHRWIVVDDENARHESPQLLQEAVPRSRFAVGTRPNTPRGLSAHVTRANHSRLKLPLKAATLSAQNRDYDSQKRACPWW